MNVNDVTIIVLVGKSLPDEDRTALVDKAKPFACQVVEYSDPVANVINPLLWTQIKDAIRNAQTEYVCIVQKSYFDQGCNILTDLILYENGNRHCLELMHCHQVGMICKTRRSSFDFSCDFCVGRKIDYLTGMFKDS